mmetsp:Transcript_50173/g.96874  ORF Transcript_50173/g.96874 Transcript_50173/m.96874 type:complete len:98 (+) Transcript_50173:1134-1427(+)
MVPDSFQWYLVVAVQFVACRRDAKTLLLRARGTHPGMIGRGRTCHAPLALPCGHALKQARCRTQWFFASFFPLTAAGAAREFPSSPSSAAPASAAAT